MKSNTSLLILSLFLVLFEASRESICHAGFTIGVGAPTENFFPFGGSVSGPGTRYQQVYNASVFPEVATCKHRSENVAPVGGSGLSE